MNEKPINSSLAEAASEGGKKILIFIVAYNAENTIKQVINRIPPGIFEYDYEILIIDDSSSDRTFDVASIYSFLHRDVHLKILYNPDNQGYGGNQKLGYKYAMENGFDVVALLHGDGQYAPEMLEKLILPILEDKADAVFGTRMSEGLKPVHSGMPIYKFFGNRILTCFQNKILGMHLSEFHSGYRVYSVKTLREIPFEFNTNDFHFDTEIIVQLKLNNSRILEIPIPTYYGDEICYVNGLAYAWNVLKATIGARFHEMNIFYKRQFDIPKDDHWYPSKLAFFSSHSAAVKEIQENSRVLDIGCGAGYVGKELKKKGCEVVGMDIASADEIYLSQKFIKIDLNTDAIPFPSDTFNYILILDVLEHLHVQSQIRLLEKIREESLLKKPYLVVSVPNVAFLPIRIQLLLGNFNYGKRGILDLTHTHLFTFKTLKRLFSQCGYSIEKISGIPAPFPLALRSTTLSKILLSINTFLIRLFPRLFSYQIFAVAKPLPTVSQLLAFGYLHSEQKAKAIGDEHRYSNEIL